MNNTNEHGQGPDKKYLDELDKDLSAGSLSEALERGGVLSDLKDAGEEGGERVLSREEKMQQLAALLLELLGNKTLDPKMPAENIPAFLTALQEHVKIEEDSEK